MADYYIAGTISLTNGSAAIVGTGTAWQIANVAGGTIFVQGEGNALPLASIEDDTHATASLEWTGATGTYSYALLRATAFSEQLEANSNIMSRLLVGLEAGTLYRYDATGDTADRATFDERPEGFAFLAIDVNPADLYIKASATSGDWAGPFSYGTGPQGEQGIPGPFPSVQFEPPVTGNPGTDAQIDVTGTGTPADPFEITFTIPRGINGTGTGDVIGPASSVADRIATFDGTSGKALKDGGKLISELGDVAGPASSVANRVATFSGTTGKVLQDSGVILGNAAAKNTGTTAGTVAAGDDARFAQGGKNDALLALEIADLKGSRMGMIGGIADAFDDQTGVNTGGSTNATYDATNDWYAPSVVAGTKALLHFDGANGSTSIVDETGRVWTATTATISTAQSVFGGASLATNGGFIRTTDFADFAFGTGDFTIELRARFTTISGTQYLFDFRSATGQTAPLMQLVSGKLNGLVAGTTTFALNTWYHVALVRSSGTTTLYLNGVSEGSMADTASYVANGCTFGAAFNNTSPMGGFIDELRISNVARYTGNFTPPASAFNIPLNNMTLVSTAYTAASAPSTARMAVQLVEVDSVTINTDVTAEVSRDGGTTWTAVTLALSSNVGGKVYEGVASIGAQPSGTSMLWRVKTVNNKNVDVSGVVMQWS